LRHLLEAVNEAARTTRQGWIFFLSVMVYLMVTAFSISDKSMLLLTPVTLPVLRIDLALNYFFLAAPLFLLLLHFGALYQHVLLEKKVMAFDERLTKQEGDKKHALRDELSSYFLVQKLAGKEASQKGNWTPTAIYWLTLYPESAS